MQNAWGIAAALVLALCLTQATALAAAVPGTQWKDYAADAFAGTVKGYATVLPESSNILLHNGKAKYALYPVWLLNTTWKGQKYTFAMNGQTGKLVGDLPMDKSAYKKWLFGLFGTVSAALFGLSYLLWFLR